MWVTIYTGHSLTWMVMAEEGIHGQKVFWVGERPTDKMPLTIWSYEPAYKGIRMKLKRSGAMLRFEDQGITEKALEDWSPDVHDGKSERTVGREAGGDTGGSKGGCPEDGA